LTEWTVSGPDAGIAITPVANTEYHQLIEGGGATGCGKISDYLNDTLTNPCGQKFAKTTLPSNTENMSNVGSNEKNSSDINTTDVDPTQNTTCC
jgi:hypothetical protein